MDLPGNQVGLPIYQVDAFTDRLFGGNPAAVVLLERELPDALLQSIAAENNLSETAFLLPLEEPDSWGLRWFTPKLEVDLCGHATLASAHVLFSESPAKSNSLVFETRSGALTVEKHGDQLRMDFPASPVQPTQPPDLLAEALGAHALDVRSGFYLMAVFEDESTIRAMQPDFALLKRVDALGVIVTAPKDPDASGIDFVSRFFCPRAGMNEDPVTGSAHCMLTPYWAARLRKKQLQAAQLSERGGRLACGLRGARVELRGKAVTFLEGRIPPGSHQRLDCSRFQIGSIHFHPHRTSVLCFRALGDCAPGKGNGVAMFVAGISNNKTGVLKSIELEMASRPERTHRLSMGGVLAKAAQATRTVALMYWVRHRKPGDSR